MNCKNCPYVLEINTLYDMEQKKICMLNLSLLDEADNHEEEECDLCKEVDSDYISDEIIKPFQKFIRKMKKQIKNKEFDYLEAYRIK